jgi:hypothetical protein
MCSRFRSLVLLVGVLVLAACGNTERSASLTPTAPLASAPPSAEGQPSATPTAQNSLAGKYADIPQSQTEQGYYVLGEPDAPVIMTHYSDFL